MVIGKDDQFASMNHGKVKKKTSPPTTKSSIYTKINFINPVNPLKSNKECNKY
jgi:hypothetical protein